MKSTSVELLSIGTRIRQKQRTTRTSEEARDATRLSNDGVERKRKGVTKVEEETGNSRECINE